jgi:8-oxo-dGTP diphosphatase
MKHYVVGFAIDPIMDEVALIKKNRPSWQAGLFNGIGGKVEEGEKPVDAMVREFFEETGYLTTYNKEKDSWVPFATLVGHNQAENEYYKIWCFYMRFVNFRALGSPTDEQVMILPFDHVTTDNSVAQLLWLIPMAKTFALGKEPATEFEISGL